MGQPAAGHDQLSGAARLLPADGVLDALVFIGAHRADRAARAVQLVQFTVNGVTRCSVTNVLDPLVLPVREIARLYARRWDIELALNLIKTNLKLRVLWPAKPVVIQQQVWAVLTISHVLQALRLEIAGRAGGDTYEVSMPLMVTICRALPLRGPTRWRPS